MDILSDLEPFTWDQKPVLPGYSGASAIAGRRGPVVFVVTVDHDGQIEASLAKFDPRKKSMTKSKPCTEANARAFFLALEVEPVEETVTRTTRHFVLRRGVVQ